VVDAARRAEYDRQFRAGVAAGFSGGVVSLCCCAAARTIRCTAASCSLSAGFAASLLAGAGGLTVSSDQPGAEAASRAPINIHVRVFMP